MPSRPGKRCVEDSRCADGEPPRGELRSDVLGVRRRRDAVHGQRIQHPLSEPVRRRRVPAAQRIRRVSGLGRPVRVLLRQPRGQRAGPCRILLLACRAHRRAGPFPGLRVVVPARRRCRRARCGHRPRRSGTLCRKLCRRLAPQSDDRTHWLRHAGGHGRRPAPFARAAPGRSACHRRGCRDGPCTEAASRRAAMLSVPCLGVRHGGTGVGRFAGRRRLCDGLHGKRQGVHGVCPRPDIRPWRSRLENRPDRRRLGHRLACFSRCDRIRRRRPRRPHPACGDGPRPQQRRGVRGGGAKRGRRGHAPGARKRLGAWAVSGRGRAGGHHTSVASLENRLLGARRQWAKRPIRSRPDRPRRPCRLVDRTLLGNRLVRNTCGGAGGRGLRLRGPRGRAPSRADRDRSRRRRRCADGRGRRGFGEEASWGSFYRCRRSPSNRHAGRV